MGWRLHRALLDSRATRVGPAERPNAPLRVHALFVESALADAMAGWRQSGGSATQSANRLVAPAPLPEPRGAGLEAPRSAALALPAPDAPTLARFRVPAEPEGADDTDGRRRLETRIRRALGPPDMQRSSRAGRVHGGSSNVDVVGVEGAPMPVELKRSLLVAPPK